MNRRNGLLAVLLLAAAAVLSSCGDDSAGPDVVSAAGSWELWSLNGQAPPVSVDILTIYSGALDLRRNGSYAFALSGVVLEERWGATESGVWSQTGNAVSLNPNDGCTNTAVLEERDILKISSHCAEGWELVLVR